MSYFISQQADQGWRISPHTLLPKLRQRWPGVVVKEIHDPDRRYSHEWLITFPGGRLEGMLSKKQTAIVLEGPIDTVAEFVTWFEAELSPADRTLILYDESFARVIPLRGQTSIGEIVAVFC